LEEIINIKNLEINDLKNNGITYIKPGEKVIDIFLHLINKIYIDLSLVRILIHLLMLKSKYIINILNIKNIILI